MSDFRQRKAQERLHEGQAALAREDFCAAEEALDHALAAGDEDVAANLVAQHRHDLYNHEQFARLTRWLRLLPIAVKEHNPELLLAEARVATMNWRFTEAAVFMDHAERALARMPADDDRVLVAIGELATLRAILDLWVGNPERMLASLRHALTLLPLDADHLRTLFTSYSMGNYHPLTLLSFAIDYRLSALDTGAYHLTSVLIHLANTLLVFVLAGLLLGNGAAALLVMSEARAQALGLDPLAWVGETCEAGVPPEVMGLGPVPAVRALESRNGLSVSDYDLIELNEAFAAQVLACARDLELPLERVNVNGGAIALGHPIGASGTRILVTLLHEMKRRDAKRGLATLCIGGGQGIAMVVEGAS